MLCQGSSRGLGFLAPFTAQRDLSGSLSIDLRISRSSMACFFPFRCRARAQVLPCQESAFRVTLEAELKDPGTVALPVLASCWCLLGVCEVGVFWSSFSLELYYRSSFRLFTGQFFCPRLGAASSPRTGHCHRAGVSWCPAMKPCGSW